MKPLPYLQIVLTIIACQAAQGNEFGGEAIEFFEKGVRPLLANKCLKCHGRGNKFEAKLTLTSRASVLRGGENGPAAVVAKPDDSLLIKAIRYSGELQMPPDGRLSDAQVATMVRWVEQGLPWPDEPGEPTGKPAGRDLSVVTDEQRQHWAFQPVAKVSPPIVRGGSRLQMTTDTFVFPRRLISIMEGIDESTSAMAEDNSLVWESSVRGSVAKRVSLDDPGSEILTFEVGHNEVARSVVFHMCPPNGNAFKFHFGRLLRIELQTEAGRQDVALKLKGLAKRDAVGEDLDLLRQPPHDSTRG